MFSPFSKPTPDLNGEIMPVEFSSTKAFILLYVICVALMYFLFFRSGGNTAFPGDIYYVRGPRKIYVPVGSAFFLSLILYIILFVFLK